MVTFICKFQTNRAVKYIDTMGALEHELNQ